uniref:Tyrosine-protein kinase n=1 Tax=Rhabditophanes sp. KR3021 TaxID=114890 RepID=A0AC35UHA7_9BILA
MAPTTAHIYDVLYDFHAVCEEQMTVYEGERVLVLGYNNTSGGYNKASSSGYNDTGECTYIASYTSLDKYLWYHGRVSRLEAELLLSSSKTNNSSFLVRESESLPGQFSISVRFDGRVYHYRINVDVQNYFFITQDTKFKTLNELIKNYSVNPDGLVCLLQYPAPKKHVVRYDRWEIDRNAIVLKNEVGSGQYGDVYEGCWQPHGKVVAVKTLKEETMPLHEFLAEAEIMKNLNHPNLISLIGVCTREAPYFIITEFMNKGNLLDYLRKLNKNALPPSVLLHMASQVAAGMVYLESRNIIHRDIAARNILTRENYICKIADFGLARFLKEDTYTAAVNARFPIKWTAPSALAYNTFTKKSDVWSYGCLLMEIVTYGAAPYPGVELSNVYNLLERGYRMDEPEHCPYGLYQLMLRCWEWNDPERPSFSEIYQLLNSVLQQNTLPSELERSCHINDTRRRDSSPMCDGVSSFNGNNKIRHSMNTESRDISTFRNIPASPSTRRSSTQSGTPIHLSHQLPVPPAPAAKKNALKAFLQTSSSDDSPTNPSVLMYELQQKSRKPAPDFDTLPKKQRIEAFLDSLETTVGGDDTESTTTGYGTKSDIAKNGSQDSLDTIPSSANHQSELLLQLKSRLKKTTTMDSISNKRENDNSSSPNISPQSIHQKPAYRPRKLDNIDEGLVKSKAPKPPPKTVTLENVCIDDGENELTAKIRKLRHVENKHAKPTISVSPVGTSYPEPPPRTDRTDAAKIRNLAAHKIAPSQHHRPFSIQPGEANNLHFRSSSTTSSSRSLSSEENALKNYESYSINVPKRPPKRISLGGSANVVNQSPKHFATANKPTTKPQSLFGLFSRADKKVKQNAQESGNNLEVINNVPKSKRIIIGEAELNLVREKEAETKAEKLSADELGLMNGMARTQSMREIVLKNYDDNNKALTLSNGPSPNFHQDELTSTPLMKSKKRYSYMDKPQNTINLADKMSSVSKEHLTNLHTEIEDCITSFRSGHMMQVKPSQIAASRKLFNDGDSEKYQNTLLITLNELLIKFHEKCTIYAENISPYSKFKYKELLEHVDALNRQLRQYTAASSLSNLKELETNLIPDCDNSLRQVMQLVNR